MKLPEDLDQLKQLAETDPKAQFALAWFYLPEEVKQKMDFVDARYSEYQLAMFDGFSIGNEDVDLPIAYEQHDLNQAFEWLNKAAESCFEESYYPLAYLYFEKDDIGNSEVLAQKSENLNFREGAFLLGQIYFSKQNYSLAHEYYAKALSAGTIKAFSPMMKTVFKGDVRIEHAEVAIEKFKPFMLNRLEKNLKICRDNRFWGQEFYCAGRQEIDVPDDEDDDNQFENSLERMENDYKWMVNQVAEAGQKISNNRDQRWEANLQRALEEQKREMLSFFTHTMRNALATAPEALRQAIQLLGSEVYEQDSSHYKAINKMTALFSSLSLTDSLIDTFKQSITDPQEFKNAWQSDNSGDATPKWVIAAALRQGLNRILFMSDTTQLRVLLDAEEVAVIKAMRKSFIDKVLPLNLDEDSENAFLAWVNEHLPKIEVVIDETDDVHFGASQTRFSLLFAITSELMLNALKYWDGQGGIRINWQRTENGDYLFSVINHCQPSASSRLAGTHKGLAFIKRLIELLGTQSQFNCQVNDQVFTASLVLNQSLLSD